MIGNQIIKECSQKEVPGSKSWFIALAKEAVDGVLSTTHLCMHNFLDQLDKCIRRKKAQFDIPGHDII